MHRQRMCVCVSAIAINKFHNGASTSVEACKQGSRIEKVLILKANNQPTNLECPVVSSGEVVPKATNGR